MNVTPTSLPGVVVIEPRVFKDERGFFVQTFQREDFVQAGLPGEFVQDNHSRSVQGTLRGLHAQLRRPQGKLVRAIEGEIFDVCVDIRTGSPTYKKWCGVRLSAESFRQLYVPPGYAHGFYVLTPFAQVEYKCTALYDPLSELHLLWNDPDLGIHWPEGQRILSPKDRDGDRLKVIESQLPVYNPQQKD